MNMNTESKLYYLLLGLIEHQMRQGGEFRCGNESVHTSEEAANALFLPSLYLAQELSKSMGDGGFGYHFIKTDAPNPLFPIACYKADDQQKFFAIAPFFIDVFMDYVQPRSRDLCNLFGSAEAFQQLPRTQ
ncbi:MAG: hypothetical protein FWC38_03160 [Proteobacteria bacterium]|nr:hypothetical protein [Pseudomonadota bacterium]MCL2307229.1 hypothetical protein [Pseudomonadota bacterium]